VSACITQGCANYGWEEIEISAKNERASHPAEKERREKEEGR